MIELIQVFYDRGKVFGEFGLLKNTPSLYLASFFWLISPRRKFALFPVIVVEFKKIDMKRMYKVEKYNNKWFN